MKKMNLLFILSISGCLILMYLMKQQTGRVGTDMLLSEIRCHHSTLDNLVLYYDFGFILCYCALYLTVIHFLVKPFHNFLASVFTIGVVILGIADVIENLHLLGFTFNALSLLGVDAQQICLSAGMLKWMMFLILSSCILLFACRKQTLLFYLLLVSSIALWTTFFYGTQIDIDQIGLAGIVLLVHVLYVVIIAILVACKLIYRSDL